MARASIYTRKGDFGQTGIFSGKRVAKSDALIEAIGAVDELNAQIGIAIPQVKSQKAKVKSLEQIQEDLFAIGAALAGYQESRDAVNSQKLGKRVEEMEEEIDEMWGKMPPLKNFILPRGQLHLARTVCRRAERRMVFLATRTQNLEPILKYLNRLSDYLFCLTRWVNFKNKQKEVVWKS